jgi:predicted dehydrogenase
MPPIRTALTGVGLSTTVFHQPFIAARPDLFTVHAVLERRATPEHSRARDLFGPSVHVYNSLEELLADKDIDLVVVSTPNDTHFGFAEVRCIRPAEPAPQMLNSFVGY